MNTQNHLQNNYNKFNNKTFSKKFKKRDMIFTNIKIVMFCNLRD